MELREALAQISVIRDQIARTETFDGYRSVTVASTGLLAIVGAAVQSLGIPKPTAEPERYLALWIGVAVVGATLAGIELIVRCQRAGSQTSARLTRIAVVQFLPCLVVGALVTGVLKTVAPESLWMLPGLWSLLFALGVFSSAPLLPKGVLAVACYYLIAGVFCLALSKQASPLSPWTMVFTFGVGQFLAAGVLYLNRERCHEPRS